MIDADQADPLHWRRNFFLAFASRRCPGIFVVVDKTAWKAPLAAAGLDRAAPEKYPAVNLDHHRRRDLGVVPEHKVVIGTSLNLAALHQARHELRAAVDAIVGRAPHCSNSRGSLKDEKTY